MGCPPQTSEPTLFRYAEALVHLAVINRQTIRMDGWSVIHHEVIHTQPSPLRGAVDEVLVMR